MSVERPVGDVKSLIQQAKKALAKREHAKALPLLQEAVRLAPGHVEAHMFLGACLVTLGQSEEGVRALERAVELDPNRTDARYNLGLVLKSEGRLSEAAEHFNAALHLHPDHEKASAALRAVRSLMKSIGSAADADEVPSAFNGQGTGLHPTGEATQADQVSPMRIKPKHIRQILGGITGVVLGIAFAFGTEGLQDPPFMLALFWVPALGLVGVGVGGIMGWRLVGCSCKFAKSEERETESRAPMEATRELEDESAVAASTSEAEMPVSTPPESGAVRRDRRHR